MFEVNFSVHVTEDIKKKSFFYFSGNAHFSKEIFPPRNPFCSGILDFFPSVTLLCLELGSLAGHQTWATTSPQELWAALS